MDIFIELPIGVGSSWPQGFVAKEGVDTYNLADGSSILEETVVGANKILILGEVGWQCDQVTAASWSGNTCQPTVTQPIRIVWSYASATVKN